MTEAEWLAPNDAINIAKKLDFLVGKKSERKFQLFRLACCRSILHLLIHEDYRRAVEAAERVVEGQSPEAKSESALLRAYDTISAARQAQFSGSRQSARNRAELRTANAVVDLLVSHCRQRTTDVR